MNAQLTYLAKTIDENEDIIGLQDNTTKQTIGQIVDCINDGSYNTISIPRGSTYIKPNIKDIFASGGIFNYLFSYLIEII